MNKQIISISCLLILIVCTSLAGLNGYTVSAAGATAVTITSSPNPGNANISIVLTANVAGNPTNFVNWFSNSSTGTFNVTNPVSLVSGVSVVSYIDAQPENVNITATYLGDGSSNSVTITLFRPADINHDGSINFNDIVYFVTAYIAYKNGAPINLVCDLNNDKTLNFNDLTAFVAAYQA